MQVIISPTFHKLLILLDAWHLVYDGFKRTSYIQVSQEERSIFWKVIVSVILSKNVYMSMYPIPNGSRDRAI